MGDAWGIGGGGERTIFSKSSKKRSKNLKNRRNWKKLEKSDFFLTENGLKCIKNTRNTCKSQQSVKKT